LIPKTNALPFRGGGRSQSWSDLEKRFAAVAQSDTSFAPMADLVHYLRDSDYAKDGLHGDAQMTALLIGPSDDVDQNPHLRIEFDSDVASFRLLYQDGSSEPWQRVVGADTVVEAVDRFLVKRVRWYRAP
jgi:hypothetical protein